MRFLGICHCDKILKKCQLNEIELTKDQEMKKLFSYDSDNFNYFEKNLSTIIKIQTLFRRLRKTKSKIKQKSFGEIEVKVNENDSKRKFEK